MSEDSHTILKIGGYIIIACRLKGIYHPFPPSSLPQVSITVLDEDNPNLKEILNQIDKKILPWEIILPDKTSFSGLGELYPYSVYNPWPRTDYTPRTRLRLEIEGKVTFLSQKSPQPLNTL
jgi:hypothetical protein